MRKDGKNPIQARLPREVVYTVKVAAAKLEKTISSVLYEALSLWWSAQPPTITEGKAFPDDKGEGEKTTTTEASPPPPRPLVVDEHRGPPAHQRRRPPPRAAKKTTTEASPPKKGAPKKKTVRKV